MATRLVFAASLVLLIAADFLQWNWDRLAGVRGHLAARYDLARGRLRLLEYGLVMEDPTYRSLLRHRHQIELHTVAGCQVDEPLRRYVKHYNAIVFAHTDERFGTDWLERAQEEARWLEAERTTADGSLWPSPSPGPTPLWLPAVRRLRASRNPRAIPEGLR